MAETLIRNKASVQNAHRIYKTYFSVFLLALKHLSKMLAEIEYIKTAVYPLACSKASTPNMSSYDRNYIRPDLLDKVSSV